MSQVVSIKLSRFERQPWGFRLHGGTDFGTPLLIQKVNISSLAEASGLQAGDVLLKVNGVDVEHLRHKEAQDKIVSAGNNFTLTVSRGGVLSQALNKPAVAASQPVRSTATAAPREWQTALEQDRAAAADNAEDFTRQFLGQLKGEVPASIPPPPQTSGQIQNGGIRRETNGTTVENGYRPTTVTAAGAVHSQNNSRTATPTKQPMAVNKQYNSPAPIYSEENIQEVLSQHAEMLANGVKGIDFNQYKREPKLPHNSEVLKLLREQEAGLTPAFGGGGSGGNFRTPRMGGSPASTLSRRAESPANRNLNASPAFNRISQSPVGGKSQTQVRSALASSSAASEDVVTASNRPKKVGNSFQWPPLAAADHGPSASPLYIDPGSPRNSSPAPRGGVASPPPPQQQHYYSSPPQQYSTPQQQINNINNVNISSSAYSSQQTHYQQQSRSFNQPQINSVAQQLPQQEIRPQPPMTGAPSSGPSQPGGPGLAGGPGQNVSAPTRGRGVLTQQKPGMRVPICGACDGQIRGPFITALGRTWCPSHFLCNMQNCGKSLQEVGFVEEKGLLYCEDCYGRYLAPDCEKCRTKIIGNCLKAMSKTFHPECFSCAYCGKLFANTPFYLEDGLPYCEEDWNELFTTKCVACGFPIEAGDRWVEALNNNYHSQCFNCTLCKKNLEGQSFFVKAGKPFCKGHARG